MNDDKHIPEKSAGFVIIRCDERGVPHVLMLKTYNKHDLPKGHVESSDMGESPEDQLLNAAIRECYEECGFTVRTDMTVNLDPRRPVAKLLPDPDQPIRCVAYDRNSDPRKVVYLFIAETACPVALIKKNKQTGIYEHQGFKWTCRDDVEKSGLHKYLQVGVMTALDMYEQHLRVNETVKMIISLK